MNGESARQGALDQLTQLPAQKLARPEDAGLRAAIERALEACEVGDYALAVEILLSTEDDGPAERRFRCDECSFVAEWPGLVDAHRCKIHGCPEADELLEAA